METGTPATGLSPSDGHGGALAALRTASARVAELASPGAPAARDTDDHTFDADDHAVRFEELHEALSAVLDELDRA